MHKSSDAKVQEMRNHMTKYIIKRILIAIPVLLGITVIDYAIIDRKSVV